MKFFLCGLISIVCLSACVAPASMQSGRTIGKGKKESSLCFGMGKYYVSAFDSSTAAYLPVFEYSMVWGLLENLDLAVKVNAMTHTSLIVKYQFLGRKSSLAAVSAGVEVGTSPLFIFTGAAISQFSVPLYFSLHPYDNFALYGTPRYLYVSQYIWDKTSLRPGYHTVANIFGISYGIILGSRHKFLMEASHYHNSLSPSQISIGYAGPLFL